MIERLYIDHFKTFQNFEWKPGPVALLMGRNGTGKTALFEVLHLLRDLICEELPLLDVFPGSTCTRWDRRKEQKFEIDVTGPEGLFEYRLAVEHNHDRGEVRVAAESLLLDGKPLVKFEMGPLQLYKDSGEQGPAFPGNWRKSGLGAVVPGPANMKLTWFKRWLSELIVLRPNPARLTGRAEREDPFLAPDCANLASFYRTLWQERPEDVVRALGTLTKVLDGFKSMSIKVDEQRNGWLRATFTDPTGAEFLMQFDELSDGSASSSRFTSSFSPSSIRTERSRSTNRTTTSPSTRFSPSCWRRWTAPRAAAGRSFSSSRIIRST